MLTCSALLGDGIREVWDAVEEFRARVADALPTLRADQSREWMWSEVTDSLLEALAADEAAGALARRLELEVAQGSITPTAAARAVVEALLGDRSV